MKALWFLNDSRHNSPILMTFTKFGPASEDDNRIVVGPFVYTHEKEALAAAESKWWPPDMYEFVVAQPGDPDTFLKAMSGGLQGLETMPDLFALNGRSDPFDPLSGLLPFTDKGAEYLDERQWQGFWETLGEWNRKQHVETCVLTALKRQRPH